MNRLVLSFLGPIQASLDGKAITRFESNKVRALLAILAVEADRPHRRETLAGLLWPDWPQASAMSSLRNALADLRRNIGDREAQPLFLRITRDSLQFNRESDAWVDVWEFEHSALSHQQPEISNLKSAIALYRGEFLEGFSLPDSAPFEEWLAVEREALKRKMLEALQRRGSPGSDLPPLARAGSPN